MLPRISTSITVSSRWRKTPTLSTWLIVALFGGVVEKVRCADAAKRSTGHDFVKTADVKAVDDCRTYGVNSDRTRNIATLSSERFNQTNLVLAVAGQLGKFRRQASSHVNLGAPMAETLSHALGSSAFNDSSIAGSRPTPDRTPDYPGRARPAESCWLSSAQKTIYDIKRKEGLPSRSTPKVCWDKHFSNSHGDIIQSEIRTLTSLVSCTLQDEVLHASPPSGSAEGLVVGNIQVDGDYLLKV